MNRHTTYCGYLSQVDTPSVRNLMSDRDPLYIFLCHLEWRNRHNLAAYNELVAALDDSEPAIREFAPDLIHRQSPRPTRSEAVVTGHPENDQEAAMAGDRALNN